MLRPRVPAAASSAPGAITWPYSRAEMRVDAVIHAIGVILVIVGVFGLIEVMPAVSACEAAAAAIYLATLACSIFASAAYNLWPVSKRKWLLRRVDHSAIYLLIAGTYTPLTIKAGAGKLLAFVWLVSAFGIAFKLLWPGRFDRLSIALYLALAWSGALMLGELVDALPGSTMWLIGAGGVIYSLGVIFHVWERLLFQNAIWHAFVLAAATTHYAAVWTVMRAA